MQYYKRLFVLNRQMQEQARWGYGSWIRRRYGEALRRRNEAARVVKDCGVLESTLKEEWADQVKTQLEKPQRMWQ